MNLETVVCIKNGFIDYATAVHRFTKDKKYISNTRHENIEFISDEQNIRIIDDYGKGIYMDRSLFDTHFKYLSDMREDKLKDIGL